MEGGKINRKIHPNSQEVLTKNTKGEKITKEGKGVLVRRLYMELHDKIKDKNP